MSRRRELRGKELKEEEWPCAVRREEARVVTSAASMRTRGSNIIEGQNCNYSCGPVTHFLGIVVYKRVRSDPIRTGHGLTRSDGSRVGTG